MKKIIITILMGMTVFISSSQTKFQWVSSTPNELWKIQDLSGLISTADHFDIEINLKDTLQTVAGFGTCFNELGWTSLCRLSMADRESVFKELFAPGAGASFTICRMPVGANDFSRDWYSYDETAGDFDMTHFSIANDKETLIPFIKKAQQYNPDLKLWASPWSPPSWMKYNKHYALASIRKGNTMKSEKYGIDFTGVDNGLAKEQQGKEGTDMFIQEDKYFKAYALYFKKFIVGYRAAHIDIGMVMPQNEFNSAQPFPSCTWTAKGLAKFISYLGPQMAALNVKIFFGTMERPNNKLVDTILTDPASKKYVTGVGFQWAGKDAIPAIHREYPAITLYQSEQECGNGMNDWEYAKYTWGLMKHYFSNGANAYMYWNTSLNQHAISRWGWKQNSLVSVDTVNNTYKYNYDYYILKHLSHYVRPGAKLLSYTGSYKNLLAFLNTDKSIVIVLQNEKETEQTIQIKAGEIPISVVLKPDSFNTILIQPK